MSVRQKVYILLFILLTVSSLSTRFWRLDFWSFSGDELATKVEMKSLLSKSFFECKNIYDALPRAVPLGYLWNSLFITRKYSEEFTYRLGPAIAGTLAVPIIFLMASRLSGITFGLLLSLSLIVSRWHILFAQYSRFYSLAFLLCSISLLSFCLAFKEDSWKWGLLAGITAGLSSLTHTVSSLVFMLEMVGITAVFVRKINIKRKWLVAFLIPAFLLVGLESFLFTYFCGFGWNKGATWGYTPIHLLLGIASDAGWPIMCFAFLGIIVTFFYNKRDMIKYIFVIWFFLIIILSIIATKLIVFRQDYIFPISLPFYALSVFAVCEIGNFLESNKKTKIAMALYLTFLSLPLPSLASYYQDGQRFNWRQAAQILENNVTSTEIVYATAPGNLKYYLKTDMKILPFKSLNELKQNCKIYNARCWVVVNYGRSGLSNNLRKWLDINGNRLAHIVKKRFDYYQFVIDIYFLKRNL